jgi:hypothetical protein
MLFPYQSARFLQEQETILASQETGFITLHDEVRCITNDFTQMAIWVGTEGADKAAQPTTT